MSLWIRLQLEESPVFQKMKEEGNDVEGAADARRSRAGATCKIVLIALFGAVAGQAVVWYTGQFYALFFLEKTLKVDGATANILIAIALALATPFFIFFGWLSDRIGRKPIILAGCALAALTYFPLFEALTRAANPALYAAQRDGAGRGGRRSRRLLGPVRPDRPEQASTATAATSPRAFLAKAGVAYANRSTPSPGRARGSRSAAVVDIPDAPPTGGPDAQAR